MCKTFFKRYWTSILAGIILVGGLAISYYLLEELNPVIAAVGGLLFTVPIRFFWQSYNKPVLNFNGIETAVFPPGDADWRYKANRIIVKNSGRSAAKNCKGSISIGTTKVRVCWMVPKERPNATINAHDEESLDFCAFYVSGPLSMKPKTKEIGKDRRVLTEIPKIIAPTEEKWYDPQETPDSRILDKVDNCKVLITADNANPVEAKIKFDRENNEIKIL